MGSKLNHSNTVSAPCKVHLLGEHSVVYGKPAILTSVNLRVYVTISKGSSAAHPLKKIIEPIIKKHLKIKTLPPYQITISSEAPIGSGLGSSAAISSSYIAALLTFLKVNWDLNLINKLAYEAEKTFQGNPSGGDNATVVYGGLIWFRKESEDLKIIHPLPFTIPTKLAKNFIFIDTGRLKEITAEMVKKVKNLYLRKPKVVEKFLGNQERLVKELLPVMKDGDEKEFIRIIRQGERNLETIGVCSKEVTSIIRNIEQSGGAAKICGAGSDSGPTGVLLCYHKNPLVIQNIAKSLNLSYFKTHLGVEGLRKE